MQTKHPGEARISSIIWAYVGPMVTQLESQSRKNGRSRNHCKTQYPAGVGGEGRTPLSPTERRDAYGNDTARAGPLGPLAGI